MELPTADVTPDGDDAADIVFPSGKSANTGTKNTLPSASAKSGRGRDVAKGDYGNSAKVSSAPHTKKRRAPAPAAHEPPRTPLQSGIYKLVEASVRFNPERDGTLKRGFAGPGLTPPELREILRRLFSVRLTDPELSAVFAHFVPDGGMELDGDVFFIHFMQMGQAERDRRRTERLEAERKHMAQTAFERADSPARGHGLEESGQPLATVEWGPEDEATAMAMVTEAAASYNKYSPAAVSLEAFEGATMTPSVFREQLRRVFNIKLTSPQLAALMAAFDKDGDGVIDCAEFLLRFFIAGFQERSRRLEIRRDGERRRKEKEAADEEARRAAAEARARMQVNYKYTSEEQAKGLAKLVEAAVLYDATGPASLGLGAFQGDNMLPHVFKEQLRRVFNIKLSPAELGGVMHRFDKDKDGTVDVVEFTKAFFKMGFDERTRRTKERREAEATRAVREKEEEEKTNKELDKRNALQVEHTFSEAALASAMAKIKHAATRYDKNHPSAVALDAFDGAQMEPHVFREQLKRVFRIKLTPPELGAAIHTFDKDGDRMVSCPEFLLTFFRIGFQAKEALRAERRAHDRAMENRAAEEAAEKERELEHRAALTVTSDFDDEDRVSAMAKVSEAAARYDKNHPSCLGLDAFEGALMPPHVFKEQLKRVFGLKLTPGELGAMMQEFDKDGDGTVNCSEFLLTFFRVGFATRNKALQRRREEEAAKLKRAAKEETRRLLENQRRKGEAALAPYTEKDLDDTLDLLIEAGARYDRRQLGPAGLKAWEVKCMNPSELKEALRRTFDLKVSPQQLGAMAHLFGTSSGTGEGEIFEGAVFAPQVQIEVPEFLTTFFKISAVAKGLASKRDAAPRLREYRVALKERLAQQEEVRRTLKAMREHPPKRPLTVDSGLARASTKGKRRGRRGGAAMDPAQRIRHHLAAARSTSRLDLSTWAERRPGDFLLSRVPRQVWHLTFLTELWLTNNDLRALTSQIKELRVLKTLGVGRNRISRLPRELGLLPDLEQIFAENNWLSTLPRELANCRKLRELRLDGNQMSRLPDCVPELRGLEVLDLRGNSIEALPPDLKFLRALLDLDLDGNPVGPEIPDALFALVNLARLSLAGTKLGPAQGAQLEAALRLDTLTINPDAAPPPEAETPRQEQEQHVFSPVARGKRGVRHIATAVPVERLPEIRDQIPGYTTKRLPGLDLLPSDAKAMMRAKASRQITIAHGSSAIGGTANARGRPGIGGQLGAGVGEARSDPALRHTIAVSAVAAAMAPV